MPDESKTISSTEMRAALQRSGYLLESRLESVLTQREFINISANVAYPDPLTGKSRELDLQARNISEVEFEDLELIPVWVNLFIECVNNSQPLAFFDKPYDAEAFIRTPELRMTGLPLVLQSRMEFMMPLPSVLKFGDFHHYSTDHVATQFCTFMLKRPRGREPSPEWMATHDERDVECFRKLCFALDQSMAESLERWVTRAIQKGETTPALELFYPVLAVQGQLMQVTQQGKKLFLRRTDHVQYHRSEILEGASREFRIDVVTESFFPKLVDMLMSEADELSRRLYAEPPLVAAACAEVLKHASARPGSASQLFSHPVWRL